MRVPAKYIPIACHAHYLVSSVITSTVSALTLASPTFNVVHGSHAKCRRLGATKNTHATEATHVTQRAEAAAAAAAASIYDTHCIHYERK